MVLGYDFLSASQIWNDGTELCYWIGASSDPRVNDKPVFCEMRVAQWDYSTPDAGPHCDGLNRYDIAQKWYNTDAWGRCHYVKVSDETSTEGVVIGKMVGCDKPGAPGEVICKRAPETGWTCPPEGVPFGRRTTATLVVSCAQNFY